MCRPCWLFCFYGRCSITLWLTTVRASLQAQVFQMSVGLRRSPVVVSSSLFCLFFWWLFFRQKTTNTTFTSYSGGSLSMGMTIAGFSCCHLTRQDFLILFSAALCLSVVIFFSSLKYATGIFLSSKGVHVWFPLSFHEKHALGIFL